MRLDKFLNATNILKRRSIAQDMIESGVVFLNGTLAKSSKDVKVGDTITLKLLESTKNYEVLQIPTTKTIKKTDTHLYWREK